LCTLCDYIHAELPNMYQFCTSPYAIRTQLSRNQYVILKPQFERKKGEKNFDLE